MKFQKLNRKLNWKSTQRLTQKLKGDTLVEVALAVGIFSMVAIAVVSVVNATTSSAQGALEMTLAREGVDAQAEALRFIQTNAAAGDVYYVGLWNEIAAGAVETVSEEVGSCGEILNGAFIVNVRGLNGANTDDGSSENAIISDASKFREAVTYPRIVYENEESLLNTGNAKVEAAEGIYVVAVKDNDTTIVVTDGGTTKKSAYYDFYIRTCWYPTGATRPSTISTIVRLNDPI